MDTEAEIHTIKNSIISLQNMLNGIVHKLANLSVLENQQTNDRGEIGKLSEDIEELSKVMLQVNTTIATMNGIAQGKRTMWVIFGSGITLAIAAIVTAVIVHNSTLDVHTAKIKALESRIKVLEKAK